MPTLQLAALFIVYSALRLAVRKKMASDGFDCVIMSSAITGVPKFLRVEAEVLDTDSLCTAFTSAISENHNSTRWNCGLVDNKFALLEFKL